MYPKKSSVKSVIGSCVLGASLIASSVVSAKEISVWCWDPNFNVAIMKEAARRYARTHPDVSVNIIDFSRPDIEQKLQIALSSGSTGNLPDIVLIEDYSAQKFIQSFPNAFEPMSGTVDYSQFAPYKVRLMSYNDKVYGMPFDSGVTGLFYRKDYLAQAGFKPADMENITWQRYIEIGKAVRKKTGHPMIGLDPDDLGLLRLIMQSGGEWYFDQEGKANIKNNASLKASLEILRDMHAAGIVSPASGWANWVNKFTSGKVASVITGVWITGTIKSRPEQSGLWGVAPVPSISKGGSHASNSGGSSWYVLASGKEKAEAVNFLNEVYAKDVEFYQAILQQQGAVGSLLKARTGKAYQENDTFFGNTQVWQRFSQWLGEIPPVNYGTFTYEVDDALKAHMPAIDHQPVEQVLNAIDRQVATQIQ